MTGKDCFKATRRLRAALLTSSALALAWALPATPSQAQNATWLPAPATGDYNTGSNWSTGSVPTGTALFGSSTITSLSLSSVTTVGGWTFNPGVTSYSFSNNAGLTFTGAGIVINDGYPRSVSLSNNSDLSFFNYSTAADTVFTNNSNLYFYDGSTAGTATFANTSNGHLYFFGSSTAGSATIVNDNWLSFSDVSTAGSASITNNSALYFLNTSSAGSATITNSASGSLYFNASSKAGNAAITNNGALTFNGTSSADSATINNSIGGTLNFNNTSTAGGAGATITNNGTLNFNATSTAGSATITNTDWGSLYFYGNSTAGSATITNSNSLSFNDASSAGNAAINNKFVLTFNSTSTAGSANIANRVALYFNDTSTAGGATITNYNLLKFNATSTAGSAAITNADWGNLYFYGNSTAGSATIANAGSGNLYFYGASTAGNAAITNTGNLYFNGSSTAGSAAITNNLGGTVDFSAGTGPNGDGKISAGSIAGAGSYILGGNELTVGSNNLSTEVSGVISGVGGSLVKIGSGTLTLAGTSTYTGGTTISSGILQLGDLNTAGAVAGAVNVASFSGTFDVVNADTSGITSIINRGYTNFRNGTSTGSAMIFSAGYLTFYNTSTAGSANITNNLYLDFLNSSTAGSAAITNNLDLSFHNSSTAASAFITNNRNLYFYDSSTAGSAAITNNNSSLYFYNNSTAGNAAITNNLSSTVDFSGTTGLNGDGRISAGSIAGTGNYILGGNQLTVGANNRSTEVSGVISGVGGSLVKTGSGTLTLSGTNSYTGGTTVAGGTLSISSDGNLGNGGTLALLDGTTLAFTQGGTYAHAITVAGDPTFDVATGQTVTQSGTISDGASPGDIVKTGAGTLILTADNTYSGGTTISGGTLQLGNGGTSGSILGNVVNNGALAFDRSDVVTFSGSISGSGTVQQIGSGTTILTGTNSYTGDTTVSAGRLQFGNGGAGGSNNLGGNVNVTGGMLAIQTPATLNVTQTVTFGDNTALSIMAGGSSPALAANSVAIGNNVAFNISGISDASQLNKVLINTTSGISGDFAAVTVGGFSGTVDYLTLSTGKSADGLQYLASYGLSWTANNNLAHGTFTLTNPTDSFTVGAALTDQAANAATGWNGTSLTKAGAGTLILTGHNTYSGGTTISRGTLQIGSSGVTGAILGTVTVGSAGTFDLVNADTSGITSISNDGATNFRNSTSAGSANISNNGVLSFYDDSTAGSASITNNSGGSLLLTGNATAGSATITNNYHAYFYGSSTAGSATITNNNWLSFNETSTADHATLTNNSWLYFYNNSTAGSATITNSNLLVFRDDATAGNASITNSNTINFVVSSTAGSAVITNNAGGTTSFQDNSTAGNAQLINNAANAVFDFSGSSGPNGDHKLSAGSIAGNGTFYLGANELTVGGNNLSTTVSGVIADGGTSGGTGGSLVKTGTGTLTLSGFNSYSGGTTFAGGTVSVSSEANLGDVAGGLTFNGGTLQISGTTFNATARSITVGAGGGTLDIAAAANNFVISQNLSGGALTKSGAGTLTLTGADNLSALTISAGTLVFSGTATAGSTEITNNARLTFDTNATAGSAIIANSGNVLFDGNATAGNAQLVNSTPSAVFDFSMSTGPNSDNKLSAGSLAGGGTFDLGGKELTVGSNNLSTNVTGVLADGGSGGGTGASLVKVGTGRLTLSGVNTYTGATTIDGGTLAVNGDITASSGVTVNSGGALGGTGIVGTTTIASGGTLAPGNSIGTLSVSGNLTFSAGSFYTVEVSPTAADRTNVSGTATLTGATVQAVAIPGSFRSQTYTILNATGGLGGTQFAGISVTGSFSPTRNPHLTYDLNNVYLVLDPGTLQLASSASGNQTSVAGGINSAVASGATPPAGFDALLNMNGAQLNRGLNQVSGQPGAAGTQAAFSATQQFVSMLDPSGAGGMDGGRGAGGAPDGGALGYASTGSSDARVRDAYAAVTPREASGDVIDRRWGVWASGYGGASTLSGNAAAGSSTTTSRIYGTVVGADYRVSPDTLVGFALGGAGFNFAVADSLGGGRADVFQAGLYARHNFGPAYLSAALAYGWQDVTTDRTVTVSGTDRLTANYKASTFAGRLEAGWRFAPIPASSFGVTPYAAVQATTFHLPGYGETAVVGSNQFALSYTAQDTTNVRTEVGARTDQRFLVNDGVLTLRGRLAWAHDTNTNRFVSAAFQTLPGAAFTVSGAQPAADSALLGGRAEMKWRNGLTLAGTVEGEFSRSTQTYTGKGTVRYEW